MATKKRDTLGACLAEARKCLNAATGRIDLAESGLARVCHNYATDRR